MNFVDETPIERFAEHGAAAFDQDTRHLSAAEIAQDGAQGFAAVD